MVWRASCRLARIVFFIYPIRFVFESEYLLSVFYSQCTFIITDKFERKPSFSYHSSSVDEYIDLSQ